MDGVKIIAIVTAGLLGVLAPTARAGEWNQKATFTFSGPVEMPELVLSAGTYVFKLAALESYRNIVQVFSKNEDHLYGTFLTTPDYRLKPAEETTITFDERPRDAPRAVRAWFYPGENYGHGFVYPKVKAAASAAAND